MSGSALSNWAIDNNPKATALELAQFHECPTTNALTMIKCLQALPAKNIIEVKQNVKFFLLIYLTLLTHKGR